MRYVYNIYIYLSLYLYVFFYGLIMFTINVAFWWYTEDHISDTPNGYQAFWEKPLKNSCGNIYNGVSGHLIEE